MSNFPTTRSAGSTTLNGPFVPTWDAEDERDLKNDWFADSIGAFCLSVLSSILLARTNAGLHNFTMPRHILLGDFYVLTMGIYSNCSSVTYSFPASHAAPLWHFTMYTSLAPGFCVCFLYNILLISRPTTTLRSRLPKITLRAARSRQSRRLSTLQNRLHDLFTPSASSAPTHRSSR